MLADRKRAEEDKATFEELKGRYIRLAMTDGKINLHTLDSVAEYYEQGESQHICVGTSKYFLKADTLVFTATMGSKTIATVEISLNDYSILQCRAFANKVRIYRADYQHHQRQQEDDSQKTDSISHSYKLEDSGETPKTHRYPLFAQKFGLHRRR